MGQIWPSRRVNYKILFTKRIQSCPSWPMNVLINAIVSAADVTYVTYLISDAAALGNRCRQNLADFAMRFWRNNDHNSSNQSTAFLARHAWYLPGNLEDRTSSTSEHSWLLSFPILYLATWKRLKHHNFHSNQLSKSESLQRHRLRLDSLS